MTTTRNAVRIAGAALAVIAAAAAFQWWCALPYQCSRRLRELEPRSYRAVELSESPRGKILARENLEQLDAIRGACRNDLTWMMLYAANCRVVGELESASEQYTRALALYQRPELYYNRAMTRLAMHDLTGAVRDLAVAAQFNTSWLDDLDAPTRQMVNDAMAQAH